MTMPPRQKRSWLAPLGWGIGALAVVVASFLAMRQGALDNSNRSHRPLQAAAAYGPAKAEPQR